MACLRAATFGLLFALTALIMAKTPPRFAEESGVRNTATTTRTASTTAQAAVTIVPPFVGDHSETWEEFGGQIDNGTSILGGIATISGNGEMLIERRFQMCTVVGRPSDGFVLMDQDRPHDLVTISFSQPVSAFGAYWGSGRTCPRCCGYDDAPSILTFQDVNGNRIGGDSFFYHGDGTLMWRGYTFGTPVKTITRTAGDGSEGVAIDGMQVVSCTATPTGLVSQWPGDGNFAPSGAVTFATGKVAQAFSFDGRDGLVDAGNAPNLNTVAFSVDAWIRPNVNTSFRTISSKWQQNGADRSWGLFIAGSGTDAFLDAYVTAAGGFPRISGGTIPVGTGAPFTNVAMTYSAADGLRIYVDGAEVGSAAAAGNMLVSTQPVRIGDTPDTGVPFDGLIDHVQYFDRALTAAEVASIYDAGGAGNCGPTPTPTATPTPTPTATPTPTPTVTPTPTPTATPTPTCSPGGTKVDGQGTILGQGDQATFSTALQKGKKKRFGAFSFSDPAASLSIVSAKVKSLTITGNTAHFSGLSKQGKQKSTFTLDVTDNCDPGTLDMFSIQMSTGYSASGHLTSGNISIHN